MKNKSMLMFIGILVTLIVVACVTPAFAETFIIGGGNTNAADQNEVAENTVGNTVGNTTANVTANIPSTTTNIVRNTTTTTNTTLPQTGVTDGYVVAILVAVCGISAIYAYRKIRNYNIK